MQSAEQQPAGARDHEQGRERLAIAVHAWDFIPAGPPEYLAAIFRKRYWIAAFFVATLVIAWVASKFVTPLFEATATVEIRARDVMDDTSMRTQVALAQSRAVLTPVMSHLEQLDRSGVRALNESALRRGLSVVRVPSTYLLSFTYRSPDPRLAAEVANAVARSYRIRALSSLIRAQLQRERGNLNKSLSRLKIELSRAEAERIAKGAKGRAQARGAEAEAEYREAVAHELQVRRTVDDAQANLDRLAATALAREAPNAPDQIAPMNLVEYAESIRRLRESSADIRAVEEINIADVAVPSSAPATPNTKLNLAIGGLFSILLSIAVIVLADAMDRSVRGPNQIRSVLNTDVLGIIPIPLAKQRLQPGSSPQASCALIDAIHRLRTLLVHRPGRNVRCMVVTGAEYSVGKTTTAVRLAQACASLKQKTLLIDADLRRPSIAGHLGVDVPAGVPSGGYTNWRADLLSKDGIDVLLPGKASGEAVHSLTASIVRIANEAAAAYEAVVISAAPASVSSEALELSARMDSVVVVARRYRTPWTSLSDAIGSLNHVGAPLAGVVLTE